MANLEIIWTFLTGGIGGNIVLAALIVAGLLLLTLVFQAACSLADVQTLPNYLNSLLIVIFTLVLLAPLNAAIVYGYCRTPLYDFLPGWMSTALLALAGFALCVVVLAVLYVPILKISMKKSLLTGVFEQLLGLLLFSLIYAAFLIVLAIIQIANKQPQPTNKTAERAVIGNIIPAVPS